MIIYKATNSENGKCYIGQTEKALSRRKTGHKGSAFTQKTRDYFHTAIRKYGWDAFSWEVLCECESKEELDEMEYHYIKRFDTMRPRGYNIQEGGSSIGQLCKKLLSERMKNNNPMFNPELVEKMKKTKRDRVEKYGTTKWNKEYTKNVRAKLSERMKNNNPMFNPELRKKGQETKRQRIKENGPYKMGPKSAWDKEWKITFPDGKEIVIVNLTHFCREYRLTRSCMVDTSRGKRESYKNFKCERIK